MLPLSGRDRIDFDHLKLLKTDFIHGSYRKREADLLYQAPFRLGDDPDSKESMDLYILVEHQSNSERLMGFRLLRYVTSIMERQHLEWEEAKKPMKDFLFDPIVPIVLYTGETSWSRLKTMRELTRRAQELNVEPPEVTQLLLNLPKMTESQLKTTENIFGGVLRVVQHRNDVRQDFSDVFKTVDSLRDQDQLRWVETLHYLHAALYHFRETDAEREELTAEMKNIAKHPLTEEFTEMSKTYLERQFEERETKAELKAKQEDLIHLLTLKFKIVPAKIKNCVLKEEDKEQIATWFESAVHSETLADVGIV